MNIRILEAMIFNPTNYEYFRNLAKKEIASNEYLKKTIKKFIKITYVILMGYSYIFFLRFTKRDKRRLKYILLKSCLSQMGNNIHDKQTDEKKKIWFLKIKGE